MRDAMQVLLGGLAEDLRLAAEAGRPHTIPSEMTPILHLAFEGALGRYRDLERRLHEAELARGLLAAELDTARRETLVAVTAAADALAQEADGQRVVIPLASRRRIPIATAEDRA